MSITNSFPLYYCHCGYLLQTVKLCSDLDDYLKLSSGFRHTRTKRKVLSQCDCCDVGYKVTCPSSCMQAKIKFSQALQNYFINWKFLVIVWHACIMSLP